MLSSERSARVNETRNAVYTPQEASQCRVGRRTCYIRPLMAALVTSSHPSPRRSKDGRFFLMALYQSRKPIVTNEMKPPAVEEGTERLIWAWERLALADRRVACLARGCDGGYDGGVVAM